VESAGTSIRNSPEGRERASMTTSPEAVSRATVPEATGSSLVASRSSPRIVWADAGGAREKERKRARATPAAFRLRWTTVRHLRREIPGRRPSAIHS